MFLEFLKQKTHASPGYASGNRFCLFACMVYSGWARLSGYALSRRENCDYPGMSPTNLPFAHFDKNTIEKRVLIKEHYQITDAHPRRGSRMNIARQETIREINVCSNKPGTGTGLEVVFKVAT